MKLARLGPPGAERLAAIDAEGRYCDISSAFPDLTPQLMEDPGPLAALDVARFPLVEPGRIGPCVGNVGKIVCVGLNYADHAREAGLPVPDEPVLFMKATSAICGPHDDVVMPPGSSKLDWEVELGIVIGRTARNVGVAEALDHVLGYCILNDVSERHFQLERGGQWTKGKSADTFAPIGPWLVTRDEVPDPQGLRIWLEVDGVRRQDSSTAEMIFGVAELVSYISGFMSLRPGDIISTGTPPGVGHGMNPPVYLAPGQVMRAGIEGLGEQEQRVVQRDG